MTDLFEDQEFTIDPEKDYTSDLIGEGRKYIDQKSASRALLEKDAFIERLKRENAGVRSDLNARMRLEDALDKLAATPRTEEAPATREELPNADKPPTYSPEDVAKMVKEEVDRNSQEASIQRNLKQVKDRLKDAWGEDYSSKLKQLANKLDVGENFLDDVAKKNPTAFFQLVGISGQPTPKVEDNGPFAPPRSRNTAGFVPASNDKNWTYYENLRKTNPGQYWSPRVQNEIHNAAFKADKENKDFGIP